MGPGKHSLCSVAAIRASVISLSGDGAFTARTRIVRLLAVWTVSSRGTLPAKRWCMNELWNEMGRLVVPKCQD